MKRPVMVPRPALVISRNPVGPDGLLIWALMITNLLREQWPGDVPIPDSRALGLIIPSKVRTSKIMSIESGKASLIGRLDRRTFGLVHDLVLKTLG